MIPRLRSDLVIGVTRRLVGTYILDPQRITCFLAELEEQLSRRCAYIMHRGKRKGEPCGRRCPGEECCKTHLSAQNQAECPHVFRTGQLRDQACKRRVREGEEFCARHRKRSKPNPSEPSEPSSDTSETVSVTSSTSRSLPVVPDLLTEPELEPEPITEHESGVEPVSVVPESDSETEVDELVAPENQTQFRPAYSAAYQHRIADPTVPRIQGLSEEGSDDDSVLDTSDLTEIYAANRSWGCQYWIKDYHFFCLETTVINDQFCAKHKRYAGKVPYKLGPHNYPMLEIDPVFHKIHNLTGQFWYPRLLLTAKPTSEGIIVIGRLLGQRWIQALTRREIKRCHNNGLLYKVLPQEVVHYNYHIPDLDSLPGEGYTSFDQLRFDRPRLYVKYWKIWNRHISDRKQFFQKYKSQRNANDWRKEHTCPLPDWTLFEQEYAIRGLRNVIVPPPTVEQSRDPAFDPWAYCEAFYEASAQVGQDGPEPVIFPPYYLDYPDPFAMRFRPYASSQWHEEVVNVHTPRRIKHYGRSPQEWLERVTTGGREWMQIYF